MKNRILFGITLNQFKMEKTELITRITDILKDFGCFSVGELEHETSDTSTPRLRIKKDGGDGLLFTIV